MYHFNDAAPGGALTQGILMALAILWVNVEQFLGRLLVSSFTMDLGYLFKELHPHRLYFDSTTYGHLCDLCRARIREGYRCKQCDFDLCHNCFRRRNKSRAEGVLRGDKGVKDEDEISSRQFLLRALSLLKPHWILVTAALTCLLSASAANLLLPRYQGSTLDYVNDGDKTAFFDNVKIYILISIATGTLGSIRSLCFNLVGARITNDIRNQLFSSLIVQDTAFYDGTTTGELTSRLSTDVYAMVAPCQTVLASFLSNFLQLGGGLVLCFITSWRLSILAITTIIPISQLSRHYAVWSGLINKQIWAALGDASSVATQAIANVRTVKAFGGESHEIGQYMKATDEALRKSNLDAAASAGTYSVTSLLDLATTTLLLWYGGSLVLDHEDMTIGRLITFQLYWGMINSSFDAIMSVLNSFTRAAGAAQRVLTLMDNQPDLDPLLGKPVTHIVGDLKMNDVHFVYQQRPDNPVLKGINLHIPAGTTCAIVGKSGGGKSTIIHLLMRFYSPTEGRICLDDVDLAELQMASVRRHVGLVAQDTQLFAGTITENIAYGLDMTSFTQEQIQDAAKMANAHDFIVSFEDGYDTRVGERGVRLSGGQKQRIAIARAVLRQPRLLFLDEATSALDAESEALVQSALDRLLQVSKCTVILVAHRLSTVMNADQIAVVDGGIIKELGPHQQLIQRGGIYAKLVARQLALKQNQLQLDEEQRASIAVDISSPQGKKKQLEKQKQSDLVDDLFDQEEQEQQLELQRQRSNDGQKDEATTTTSTTTTAEAQ